MEILNLIILYFNCGTLRTDRDCKIATITKFADIVNILIPFFQKHPLQGVKQLDLTDFIKVAELIKTQSHLTSEGLNEILLIKSGMNRGRDHSV
jgi:LAGLIDADG endonuclease